MLSVRIASLSPGVHTLAFSPSATDLDLDPEAFRDLAVDVVLDYDPQRIYVRLRVRAVATLLCDRTLVPFEQPVEGAFALLYAVDAEGGEADDLRPLAADATDLDLAEPVRDTLLLALPARCVAPGAEDAPIQTRFGALLDDEGNEIDPRWEALRRFQDPS